MYLGYTSLISASKEGHSDVVRFLLEKDADVNAYNKNGKLNYRYLVF